MKKALLLAASGIAALAVAAPALALSPSDYRLRMNSTCAFGVAKINAVPLPKTPSGYYHYFSTVSIYSQALAINLLAIPIPASLKVPVTKAFGLQGRQQGALEELVKELKTSKQPQKLVQQALPVLNQLGKAANTAWRAAGLPKCAG